jgi:hypothetical protein
MRNFKFFRGYGGTLDMIDDTTRATASFNDDTPEGHMNRRRLYHTDINQYDRLRHPNNEMEQYFNDRNWCHDNLTAERRAEITRSINGGRDLNDNPIRLFQTTTTVTVNPTFWNRVKIFGTGVKLVLIETWRVEPIGVVVVSILLTLVTIIGIAKILSIW